MKYEVLYDLDKKAVFDDFNVANIFTLGLTALGISFSINKVKE